MITFVSRYLRGLRIIVLATLPALVVGSASLAAGEAPDSGRADLLLDSLLTHYSSDADSLKREAARYLIDNIEGHGYVTYDLVDTVGGVIDWDVTGYETFDRLEAGFDRLEAEHGVLDFERSDLVKDELAVSAEFLIEHIDYAFRAWRERPWATGLSFDQFCEYVLPYRGSNEPLESWRAPLFAEYASLMDRMDDPTDPIEAASIINDDLMSWFHFDPRYYYHPTDQGLSEMKESRLGRCEDMTNLTIFAMRANGLAVTSDYTPYWANSGNNHAWNAILSPDGQVIPFMGAEANPGKYRLANKLAKVYRKTFSVQPGNLAFQDNAQESLPRYLASKSYVDVTRDYIPVTDVGVEIAVPLPDSVEIVYLCVFNSGEWKPIQWARIGDGRARFTDMGLGIAYLPGFYAGTEIHPINSAYILDDEKQTQPLQPALTDRTSLSLTSTTHRKQEVSTDGIEKNYLVAGQEYELFYWDTGWQSVGKAVAGEDPLEFSDVPAGALFRLVAADSDDEERIFTFEEGRQVWW